MTTAKALERAQQPRPRPVAAPLVATMRAAGLPAQGARVTTPICAERFTGCVERITTDDLSVLAFATVRGARAYARTVGHGATREGKIVMAYAGSGLSRGMRLQYDAALRAFAAKGGTRSVARAVSTERQRQVRVRERERIERQRRASARRAAALAREQAAASPPAAAPPPEPAAAPDYSGLNCSEIGHSYSVTPGSDPEHDANNDGIACESE